MPVLRLRGNSPATVDEKGRLKLPSSFKAELETFAQGEGAKLCVKVPAPCGTT